jgi:hypothetical protein
LTNLHPRDVIDVRPAGEPPAGELHRPFLVTSLSLATLLGFVLGIHVPLGRLLDTGRPERTADLIQAHGQVQLLGFAGLFVIGMSLRLMPRFASSRIAFPSLLPFILWLFAGGLIARAAIMPWFYGDVHSILLIASVVALLIGSACFLLVVTGTLSIEARRFEASSLAFVLGALLLFGACATAVLEAIDAVQADARGPGYLADNAILQLELNGFLLSFIVGVALRAIPQMVGIARPGRSAALLAVLLAASTLILAASLLYIDQVSDTEAMRVLAGLAFATFGLVLLGLAWQTGVVRQAANRLRPASQPNLWLVRSAVLWLVVAGLASVYYGISGVVDGELPGQLEFDAVRHSLGVGVVTMLICGMSMMILPEFAAARLTANRQKTLALVVMALLNVAALLRVLPSIAGSSWSADDRNLSMAIAGSLAETALVIFTVYIFRVLWSRKSGRGGIHAT